MNEELFNETWEKSNKRLLRDMDEWERGYKHRKPCKEFLERGFCEHLVKARTQKFRDRILGQLCPEI